MRAITDRDQELSHEKIGFLNSARGKPRAATSELQLRTLTAVAAAIPLPTATPTTTKTKTVTLNSAQLPSRSHSNNTHGHHHHYFNFKLTTFSRNDPFLLQENPHPPPIVVHHHHRAWGVRDEVSIPFWRKRKLENLR
jgi:hypothetical protein